MSTDYSTFKTHKEALPNVVTAVRYSQRRSELVFSCLEAFGYSSIPELPRNIRPIMEKIEANHAKNTSIVYVGIEVELENFRYINDAPDELYRKWKVYWLQKEDGSLRNNGIEMVSRFGLTTADVPEALATLEEYVTTITNQRVEANARTGLHVHIDVSKLSKYEFSNLLFLYSVFEPLVFSLSGGRSDNIFCVPWETNRQTLGQVVSNLMTLGPGVDRHWRWRNYSKYCGLNLASVATFGTVEFRMHKGTYKAQEIQKWVDFIEALYLYAKRTDFVDNLNRFRTKRYDHKYWDVIESVFKSYLTDINLLPVGKREELIARCKYATVSFFKHFVDHTKLPESTMVKKRPVTYRDMQFDAPPDPNVWRYQPGDVVRVEEGPIRVNVADNARVDFVVMNEVQEVAQEANRPEPAPNPPGFDALQDAIDRYRLNVGRQGRNR